MSGSLTSYARHTSSGSSFRQSDPASQSGPLAILNDKSITLDDLDPRVRELANRLDSEIEAARNRVLADEIDALLFEAEASRRRISVSRLLAIEVKQRTVDPTDEEIQTIYDVNRTQMGNADINAARPQIVAYLRRESAQKLTTDLAARLRKRYLVVMGTNVNSPQLAVSATLATVAGRAIPAGPIIERLKPVIYDLRLRVYEGLSSAVGQMIDDLLVIDEARRKGVGPEVIIRTEITDKLRPASEDQIAKFYEENKAHITGDLASARNSIVTYLNQQEETRLTRALSDKLRKGMNIHVLLREPTPPVIAVSTDDDPSRGPVTAPVTVVEFTDFQCPSCGANHPIIDEVTKSYGDKVRLVIRDFPLDIHENALKAAEAANAAFAQGKFFEYIDLLFKNQKALDVASLKKYATEIGLNRARFDSALDTGAYELEVNHDIIDGVQYGVAGTPTVFVNGLRVDKLSAETLRAAIDNALAQKKAS
jgi:protein-disulfide isomerase